jgi:peptide/nickel transport system substrate-binding protein
MNVAVVGEDYLGHEARLVVKLLKQLGYHATLRGIPKHANYFTYIADSRHRAQIGVEQWVADYPGAAGYLQTLFSCAAFVPADPNQVNVSQFCDPQADRLMQRARRLPAGDPRADALWARADQRIVNQAAAVPLTNPDAFTFVSPRVGNYQYSSQWGVLYDQLWVR